MDEYQTNITLYIELFILVAAGIAAVFCLVGCFYVVPYACCPDSICGFCLWKSGMQEFNSLWLVRTSMLLTSAALMVAHMLPLATIWSPNSVLPLWQFVSIDSETIRLLCRMFLVAALGFAEPFLLLTVLLACRASNMSKNMQRRGLSSSARILALAALFTLPILLLQSAIAFVTATPFLDREIIEDNILLRYFFAVTEVRTNSQLCTSETLQGVAAGLGVARNVGDSASQQFLQADIWIGPCLACLFPATSTIVSVLFIFLYLLALFNIFDNVARAVLNQALKGRLRVLQGVLTVTLILGVALRGVIIVAGPNNLAFGILRLAYFVTVLVYTESICWTLVWWPILDARRADWRSEVEDHHGRQTQQAIFRHSAASTNTAAATSRDGNGDLRVRGNAPLTS